MEKIHNVTPEQALSMIIEWLDEVEIHGHKNINAMSNALLLLEKVKSFIQEASKPVEPTIELKPVETVDAE